MLRIRIRELGSGAFLTPESGMGKNSGSGIRDEQPASYFRELRNTLFGLKYLYSLMRIRNGKNSDPGSGINIPDPRHWSAVRLSSLSDGPPCTGAPPGGTAVPTPVVFLHSYIRRLSLWKKMKKIVSNTNRRPSSDFRLEGQDTYLT